MAALSKWWRLGLKRIGLSAAILVKGLNGTVGKYCSIKQVKYGKIKRDL
jgi:hypothetical protein